MELPAHHAWLELREVQWIAAIQLDALDLVLGDKLSDGCALRLNRIRACLYRDLRLGVADMHGDVHTPANAGIDVHIAERGGFKAAASTRML